jgi:hypothetical protein
MARTNSDESDIEPSPGDKLIRMLDAELNAYTAVEPRAGLEERILANLAREQTDVAARAWWQWSVAAAVAAVIIVAGSLAWRSEREPALVISHHSPVNLHASEEKPNSLRADRRRAPNATSRHGSLRRAARQVAPGTEVAANPKLDQFPSPLPLSEQEKLLASYVAQFGDEAVIVARVRAEGLRDEREREARETETGTNHDVQER